MVKIPSGRCFLSCLGAWDKVGPGVKIQRG